MCWAALITAAVSVSKSNHLCSIHWSDALCCCPNNPLGRLMRCMPSDCTRRDRSCGCMPFAAHLWSRTADCNFALQETKACQWCRWRCSHAPCSSSEALPTPTACTASMRCVPSSCYYSAVKAVDKQGCHALGDSACLRRHRAATLICMSLKGR